MIEFILSQFMTQLYNLHYRVFSESNPDLSSKSSSPKLFQTKLWLSLRILISEFKLSQFMTQPQNRQHLIFFDVKKWLSRKFLTIEIIVNQVMT